MGNLSHLVGKRIKLIHMGSDPSSKPDYVPVPDGTEGVVRSVANVQGDGVIMMNWDNGRTLNMIESLDTYQVLD
jgi:hypothetical protein